MRRAPAIATAAVLAGIRAFVRLRVRGREHVPLEGAAVAERLLDGMRFVPCYPELPDAVVERMAGVLRAHAREAAGLA